MLTVAARSVLRQAPKGVRSMHVDNVVGNNTPFSYKSGPAFGAKIVLFCATGFATPFVACAYQLHKASA